MSTTTPFLGLTKPAATERYDIGVFNDNADKVDAGVLAATEQISENSAAVVELVAANNTHHQMGSVTALDITFAEGLHRTTISFTAGASDCAELPTGTICAGADCSGGAFTAVSGKRYTVAVLHDGEAYTAAVSGYEVP